MVKLDKDSKIMQTSEKNEVLTIMVIRIAPGKMLAFPSFDVSAKDFIYLQINL